MATLFHRETSEDPGRGERYWYDEVSDAWIPPGRATVVMKIRRVSSLPYI